MNEKLSRLLLGPIMVWTVVTTIFAWLPLVRIVGRPEGYHWRILGLSGEGFDGPFWLFIPLTMFAIALLYTAERGPRNRFRPLLIIWHVTVLVVIVAALIQGGADARWQGQGLYWSIPMWLAVAPAALFTIMAIVWVAVDLKGAPPKQPQPWSRTNTLRLTASLLLLVVAIVLFRFGTNYNWVTAVAIVTTVLHWLLLAWSFVGEITSSDVSFKAL